MVLSDGKNTPSKFVIGRKSEIHASKVAASRPLIERNLPVCHDEFTQFSRLTVRSSHSAVSTDSSIYRISSWKTLPEGAGIYLLPRIQGG